MQIDPSALLTRLDHWVEAGAVRALDRAFAAFIARATPETDPAVLLAAALVSERHGHGHVCLDLEQALAQPETLLSGLRDDQDDAPEVRQTLAQWLGTLSRADWTQRLAASAALQDCRPAPADGPATPLVLAGSPQRPLLYLRRYWEDERRILASIQSRLAQPPAVDATALRQQLDSLFSGPPSAVGRWQKIACALAARSAFAVITGGPGTGKTTTVVRLLAVLQGLRLAAGEPPLRIRLAAPTGKAAARLNASTAQRIHALPLGDDTHAEAIRQAIPTQVTTLHRLLGPIRDSRRFRHRAGNPLPVDLVVVDEASMVDVELMARLLEALPAAARLILLGDKDQLASVEAGAVLGDLCQRAADGHYLPETQQWLAAATGEVPDGTEIDPTGRALDQSIAMLRESVRFSADGGIGALAALVNSEPHDAATPAARAAALLALCTAPVTANTAEQVTAIQLRDGTDTALEALAAEGYRGYLERMQAMPSGAGFGSGSGSGSGSASGSAPAADPEALDAWALAILEALGQFQLLTPLRQGPWGVEGLNRRIAAHLTVSSLIQWRGAERANSRSGQDDQQWYAGRPVLVTRNDEGLRLMNGDVGVTLAVPALGPDGTQRQVLRVAFPTDDPHRPVRWILPSRLQSVQTVFAMTVHKSQGSEFTHTALVLPDRSSPVLTRELLYTAITRSRQRFTLLYSHAEVIADTLAQRVQRVSGLQLALA